MLGSFVQRTVCPDCRGEGKKAEKPCTECGGEGRTRQSETLVVDIPAGIEHGTRLRITGEGEAPPGGGDTGDLYIFVRVQPHKEFKRDGMHIRSSVAIPFITAALGGTIHVKTVDGEEQVKVSPGTQSGAKLRISGKGIRSEPTRGDHIITVSIDVPKRLSRKQKDLLREFESAEGKSGIRRFLG
jgi:molecular chaperone DnaJ